MTGQIKVVHVKNQVTQGFTRVYCGRAGKGEAGTFGNPFWMSDESKRDECCDKFGEWLHKVVEHKGIYFLRGNKDTYAKSGTLYGGLRDLYKRVKAGENIELACFCAPKRCHCDSIKKFLEEHL